MTTTTVYTIPPAKPRTAEPPPAKSSPPWIAAAVAVAIGLGGFAATQLWPLWQEYQQRTPPRPDTPSATEAPALPAPDMKIATLGTDSSLSATPLDLRLVWTSPGRNAREGTAALGVDIRNPQTYAAGALLANGARLVEIHADRVVLEREGRRTELRMGAVSAQELMPDSQRMSQAFQAAPVGTDPTLTRVGGGAQKTATRPSTVDLVSDIVRAASYFESGRLAGFTLYPGNRTSAFTNLGLESGDVIRSVNGLRVETEAQWDAIASALTEGGAVNVTIERGGALQSMALDANQLDAAPAIVPLPPPPLPTPPVGGR